MTDTEILACPSSPNYTPYDWHFDNNPDNPVDPCADTNVDYGQTSTDSYVYLGWVIMSQHIVDDDIDANGEGVCASLNPNFLKAFLNNDDGTGAFYNRLNGDSGAYDVDIRYQDIDPAATQPPMYRLREGIERFYVTDINNPAATARAQSTVAVMWDRFATNVQRDGFNHLPGGTNVLFLDGHVRYQGYPSEHPTTRAYAIEISRLYDVMFLGEQDPCL